MVISLYRLGCDVDSDRCVSIDICATVQKERESYWLKLDLSAVNPPDAGFIATCAFFLLSVFHCTSQ